MRQRAVYMPFWDVKAHSAAAIAYPAPDGGEGAVVGRTLSGMGCRREREWRPKPRAPPVRRSDTAAVPMTSNLPKP